MVNKIGHYALENPASVYDEEAMTAIELAGRTAKKVNEAIDLVNKNEQEVQSAKEYMVDNLPVFVDDKVEELRANGSLESTLVKAMASGKVDKNGPGQVTYAMLAQDVRVGMTGGSTAVVGVNAVGTQNIVNHTVTEDKLNGQLIDVLMYSSSILAYQKPFIVIDTATGTAEINAEATHTCELYTREKKYSVVPANLSVLYAKETKTSNVRLYLNPATGVITVTANDRTADAEGANELYLGEISTNAMFRNNRVPVTVNGIFYPPANIDHNPRKHGWLSWVPYAPTTVKGPFPAIVDFVNKKLIFKNLNRLVLFDNRTYYEVAELKNSNQDYVVDFSELSGWIYVVGDITGIKCVGPGDYTTRYSGYAEKDHLVLGAIQTTYEIIDTNFPCVSGKTVSILGDSISTFTGFNPEGNKVHYTGSTSGVTHYRQTWWARVCDKMGWILNTNNSWSGSKVTTGSRAESAGVTRASQLDNGTAPDNILVYLGVNDFQGEVALGTYDGKGAIPSTTTTFREAYAVMLKNIMTAYPSAKIYCMTLPPLERDYKNIGHPEQNDNGVYLSEFNRAIREVCDALCVEVIDTASCGINAYNASTTMGDYSTSTGGYLHPNAEGHRLIADKVVRHLK